MASAQDVEISLGTGRLLALFFALVAVCGIFFGLGYTLGRSMGPTAVTAEAAAPSAATSAAKPKPVGASAESATAAPANDLTFYKTVEQKDANPQLTPVSAPAPAAASSAPAPETTHGSAYVVQIAAVSKREDAEALIGALRKKNYPVFLASNAPADSLFHVQVGPFNELKDAEAVRGRLAGDGYSPIVKK
jgi:cell division septation protein DedD